MRGKGVRGRLSGRTLAGMSDAKFVFIGGSVIWFAGGAGLVASLMSGWTLFAPFAGVLILLGAWSCVLAAVWSSRGRRPRDTDPDWPRIRPAS